MIRHGAFVLLGMSLLAGACGVGDDTTPPNDMTDRMCQATGTVTGTWTQNMVDPDLDGDCEPDMLGSWDAGVWSFSVAVVANNCTTAPTPLPNYKFSTTYAITPAGCMQPATCTQGFKLTTPACELSAASFSYTTDPSVHTHVKTSAGGGIREGTLELFSPDGLQVWTMKPTLSAYSADMLTGTITGQFEFATFPTDQWTVTNPGT